MCGRVVISLCSKDLSKIAKLKKNQEMNNHIYYKESYNISPGQYLPCIYMNKEIKENKDSSKNNFSDEINLEAMKWGIYLEQLDHLLFNSRIETISIYKMYKKFKRCIIIIEGYYEWENKDKNKPYYISTNEKEDNVIFLPGLYNEEIDNEGFAYKSVSIITMNANNQIDFIHERMPVIFTKYQQVLDYLSGKELKEIIDKEIKMKYYLIGDLVNKLSNTSKDNILPLEEVKYNKNGNLLIKNFLNNEGDKSAVNKEINEKTIKKKNLNKINALEKLKDKSKEDNMSEKSTTIISTSLKVKKKFKSKYVKRMKIFPTLDNNEELAHIKKRKKTQKNLDEFFLKK